MPLPEGSTVDLLGNTGISSSLLAGSLVETGRIESVRFFKDGTCERFRVQIREGRLEPFLISLDPWTCAQVFVETRND